MARDTPRHGLLWGKAKCLLRGELSLHLAGHWGELLPSLSRPGQGSLQQPNDGSMLGHRLRRWPNIEPTLGQRLVFASQTTSVEPGLFAGRTQVKTNLFGTFPQHHIRSSYLTRPSKTTMWPEPPQFRALILLITHRRVLCHSSRIINQRPQSIFSPSIPKPNT